MLIGKVCINVKPKALPVWFRSIFKHRKGSGESPGNWKGKRSGTEMGQVGRFFTD